MPPPPVDFEAVAFRETKSGKLEDKSDAGRSSPFWNALRATLSAIEASMRHEKERALGWIHPEEPNALSDDQYVSNVSYFLDAEFMRTTFYHPVVILDAPLWAM